MGSKEAAEGFAGSFARAYALAQDDRRKPMIPIRESGEGVTFAVKVHPRAKKNAITGEMGEALKIALTAPPVEGRANEAVIEFLAEVLRVPRASVSIAAGQSSRNKVIRVKGLTAAQVGERLFPPKPKPGLGGAPPSA